GGPIRRSSLRLRLPARTVALDVGVRQRLRGYVRQQRMDAVDALRARFESPLWKVPGDCGAAADHLWHRLVMVSAGVRAPVPSGSVPGLPGTRPRPGRPAPDLCRKRRPRARFAAARSRERCPLSVARELPRSLSPAASTGI